MKILFLLFITIFVNAQNILWIYTDINCSKLVNGLKKDYQDFYHREIKILKAPFPVLIKKFQTQKKADLFITNDLKNTEKYSEFFNKRYKIGMKKPAIFFKTNQNYTFDDVINTRLKLGIVTQCSLYSAFKEAVNNYAGNIKLIEIKLFKIKHKYKTSSECANDLLENKIDVCIDWTGADYWHIHNKLFRKSLIKNNFYHIHYVYVMPTSFSHKNQMVDEFINFLKTRFESFDKNEKRIKKIDYLLPDLRL